jgi:hypothetical protein
MEVIEGVFSVDFKGGLESTSAAPLNSMNSNSGIVGGRTRLVDANSIQGKKKLSVDGLSSLVSWVVYEGRFLWVLH